MPFVLTAAFILSGVAGLVYESIWSRYLGLFVGHSAYAQVIVLVIYLGGMSAGSAIAARFSTRIRQPLLAYAAAEAAVGLIGLIFHDAFRAASDFAYAAIFPALAGGFTLVAVKWLIAGLLILPQSVLLGTTFPLMTAGLLRATPPSAGTHTGRVLSQLYFANSIGAAGGVLLAGFWLIGLAGLPGTLLAAALLNLVVALVVFLAVKLHQRGSPPDPVLAVAPVPFAQPLPQLWRVLLVVAAGTALTSFIYEIAWIRMLALVLGSATHSFEVMLSAFILGLALGALWVRNRADSFRDPVRALGIAQWAMGALALATLGAYVASFDWMATLISGLAQNLDGYRFFTLAKYAIALAVMLPATFCAGITLPLITHVLMAAGAGEKAIGTVYSVNTLGSIVGAGLASLVLMPLLGMKTLLVLGGALDMLLGVWLLWRGRRAGVLAAIGTAAMVAYVLAFVPLDRAALIGGVYRYGRVVDAGVRKIAFFRDGRTATVSVTQGASGEYSLATNGKPDASISASWFKNSGDSVQPLDGDQTTQVLLPLVTLAFMPQAKQGAVIGNGSGISSHMLLGSPALASLVTIDIEPEMFAASRIFYPVNRRIFDDPRSHFVYDDAKSYFAATNQKFDLILSEPSNPWVSGVSGLFTDEFYQRMRTYLTPNGIFGQWLHLYEIDDALVLSVIQAVHRNFASYEIVLTSDTDFLIVASTQRRLPQPDWRVFDLPEIVHDLQHFTRITPAALDRLRLISRDALLPLIADTSGANSDFFPTLDLLTERARYVKDTAKGFVGLTDGRFDVGAALLDRRVLPSGETVAPLGIGRLRLQALGAQLRRPPGDAPPDREFRAAAAREDLLRDVIAAGKPPADWPFFAKLAAEVDADWHSGTMGWADEAFYGPVAHFLAAQGAPAEAQAAWRFLHAISAYDWPTAAAQVEVLLGARAHGHAWLNDDLLRDGAVVALLHTGQIPQARATFDRLAKFAKRKPQDFRVQLLEAHLVAAERNAR